MASTSQPAASRPRGRRWLRWLRRTAYVLLGALLVFVFGFLPWFLGTRITTGRFVFNDRENAGLTPQSFSLPFEDVSFQSPDGVTLKGWWIPAEEARGTVVLVHGLNRSRIEMVRKVPFLHQQGWNALLFDLRGHGESGRAARTLGWFEKDDVRAARAFAQTRSPGPTVLWGVSLGAAAAILAAADDPAVTGLVSDSTYRSLPDAVRHHVELARHAKAWLWPIPAWPVTKELLFWIGRSGHFDPDAVDVRAAAARLGPRPTLFVCNSGDMRMPQDIAFELKEAAGDHAKVLVVPGHSHGGAWREGTAAYESAVADLLREAGGHRLADAGIPAGQVLRAERSVP
ncbi:MAG TPA: alpha/beta fold hydrolase [Vicinamibacteria bacterium]|nr:alpha/beta fold hydrolase [Vicinamibacteria bacterium]